MRAVFSKLNALLFLVIILMQIFPYTCVSAAETNSEAVQLSYDEAVVRAMEYTNNFHLMDENIDSAWDTYLNFMKAASLLQQQLDMMSDYEKIHSKIHNGESLDSLEQMQLVGYVEIYGPTPPMLSPQELFNNFIKPRDFPSFAMGATVENMRKKKELNKASLALGVREVYDSILSLQEAYTLQNELYTVMQKQNSQLAVKLEKGMISKMDMIVSNASLRQQKLRINKLERNIDNLMMSLKQQIGLPLTQNISLQTNYNSIIYKAPESYEFYLGKALSTRYEVVSTQLDLEVKQRELNILKEYNFNALTTDRMEAQSAVDDKSIAYREAVDKVTTDIISAYKDIIGKKEDITLAKKKMENALKQYNNAKAYYDKGMINSSTLQDAQFSYTQSKISHLSAIRTYNSAFYKFEVASGIGPGYSSLVGGN